ncbi:MAG TPA: GAF domain-containing sensor histidine kinase [Symbiobacteriaceae bacterium]|jgi:signal transduction histidine kinase
MSPLPFQTRLFLLVGATGLTPLLALPLLGLASWQALWLLPVVLAAAYGLAAAVARAPMAILAAARRLQIGDLKARAWVSGPPDWALVAEVLNQLAGRLDETTQHFEEQVRDRTEALSRKAEQLRTVGEVGRQVAAVLEPEALLHFVVRVMRGAFGYDVVGALGRYGDHLVLSACAARNVEEVPLGRAFPASGPGAPPLAGCLAGEGAVADEASPLVAGLLVRSELAVPMRLGDRTVGVLVVQSLRPAAFDSEDLFTVRTIAGQVAVALENARLLEAERHLRDLSITEERNRMAREIHDTLAQGFMGIIMHLRAMQGAPDAETAGRFREEAEALARASLQEARRSVWNLRPWRLEGKGLAGALADEIAGMERRAALGVQLNTDGDLKGLAPEVEAGLLRIAQEALHNTVKYAQATRAEVLLTARDGVVELAIADDGIGFDPAAVAQSGRSGGGFGLAGMAERARSLGGTCGVESAPGLGCRVTVRLPAGRN